METRNGQSVKIETDNKPGMTIFKVFGFIDNKPCHWTSEGKYRMDDQEHPLDIMDFKNG